MQSQARTLFRRCVQCPDQVPTCPQCADNEECSFTVGGCNACSSNTCVPKPGASSSPSTSSPAGPIAGGVIGGIILVLAIVVLVTIFYKRKRRAAEQTEDWATKLRDLPSQEGEKTPSDTRSFAEHRSHRQSTASVKTSASRQSNVIQIAYIPGVTSTAQQSPEMIPPVPPIPAAGNTTSPHLATGNEQFFMINDLRPESSYTRKSYANSFTNRSSITPSEYQGDLMEAAPARAAYAARANPISVKSNSRVASPTASPPLSHQNSIAGRMAGPITAKSGQARQVVISRSGSNLNQQFAFEMEDTSPAPTPRIGLERSGTASPRSMLSDDDARSASRFASPHQPVSAVRSEFSHSRGSPVSNYGWDNNNSNIRNTIKESALLAYNGGSAPLQGIAELDGDVQAEHNHPKSPFADRHATRTP